MMNFRRIALGALFLFMAVGASASNFRAADLVYMPAAARAAGGGGAFFKTDVWVRNVSDVTVVVDVAFARTGGTDQRAALQAANLKQFTLAPGEQRELVDILGGLFALDPNAAHVGHLLFFACRQGGNCNDCEASAADCKLITVQGRIYTEATGAGCPGGAATCTFGQLFSGIPWYNFVSPDASGLGLDNVFMSGIRQTGQGGQIGTFRANVGVANATTDFRIVARVRLFNANGTQFGNPATITLEPLGHSQQNVAVLFPGFTGTGFVVVDLADSVRVTTPPTGEVSAPIPGFFAYASVLDNGSNDPTTQEAQYTKELPYALVYNKNNMRRPARRQ
jgi:hypothetical protein